jgi:hypothetical protein
MKLRGMEVADDLCLEERIESVDGLHFEDRLIRDDEVQRIVTDDMALVVDWDVNLPLELQMLLEHLDCERFFVGALAKSGAEGAVHLDRTLDDLFGDLDGAVQVAGRA